MGGTKVRFARKEKGKQKRGMWRSFCQDGGDALRGEEDVGVIENECDSWEYTHGGGYIGKMSDMGLFFVFLFFCFCSFFVLFFLFSFFLLFYFPQFPPIKKSYTLTPFILHSGPNDSIWYSKSDTVPPIPLHLICPCCWYISIFALFLFHPKDVFWASPNMSGRWLDLVLRTPTLPTLVSVWYNPFCV